MSGEYTVLRPKLISLSSRAAGVVQPLRPPQFFVRRLSKSNGEITTGDLVEITERNRPVIQAIFLAYTEKGILFAKPNSWDMLLLPVRGTDFSGEKHSLFFVSKQSGPTCAGEAVSNCIVNLMIRSGRIGQSDNEVIGKTAYHATAQKATAPYLKREGHIANHDSIILQRQRQIEKLQEYGFDGIETTDWNGVIVHLKSGWPVILGGPVSEREQNIAYASGVDGTRGVILPMHKLKAEMHHAVVAWHYLDAQKPSRWPLFPPVDDSKIMIFDSWTGQVVLWDVAELIDNWTYNSWDGILVKTRPPQPAATHSIPVPAMRMPADPLYRRP